MIKKIKRNLTGINDYINVQKDLKIPFNIQLDKKNTKIKKRQEGAFLINNNNCIDNDLFINKKENSYRYIITEKNKKLASMKRTNSLYSLKRFFKK